MSATAGSQSNEPMPPMAVPPSVTPSTEGEVDITGLSERGHAIPHGRVFKVPIDCALVRVETQHPTGDVLLSKVHKRPCAYELIAEFAHCENQVVEPNETIDLRQHGLKGFITAHKEVVTIFFGKDPYTIQRGVHSVAQLLALVGKNPEGYVLLEEKDGPPMPVPPTVPVNVHGCEVFFTQPQTGGSS